MTPCCQYTGFCYINVDQSIDLDEYNKAVKAVHGDKAVTLTAEPDNDPFCRCMCHQKALKGLV